MQSRTLSASIQRALLAMAAVSAGALSATSALAQETEEAIKTGKLNPFKCPVFDQTGKEVKCEGNGALSDAQVLSMNYYVKGIDDKLPK